MTPRLEMRRANPSDAPLFPMEEEEEATAAQLECIVECITIMLQQERTTYRCPSDYMNRRRLLRRRKVQCCCCQSQRTTSDGCDYCDSECEYNNDRGGRPCQCNPPNNDVNTVSSCHRSAAQHVHPTVSAISGATATTPMSSQTKLTTKEPDEQCRRQMIEWSYKVIDFYDAPREIVSVAFALLDRFLDRCFSGDCGCCKNVVDRSTFKLASMSCLHMAGKLISSPAATGHQPCDDKDDACHHRKRDGGGGGNDDIVSLDVLAQLSRGEFDTKHLADMERAVLQTLEWRVHPPTVAFFVYYFCAYGLSNGDDDVVSYAPYRGDDNDNNGSSRQRWMKYKNDVYHRALFFSELSVFEYSFVMVPPSRIAVSAVLNALKDQYMDPSFPFDQDMTITTAAATTTIREMFRQTMKNTFKINPDSNELWDVREKLWEVYGRRNGRVSPTSPVSVMEGVEGQQEQA